MKQFFKFLTASCLGTLIAISIIAGAVMVYIYYAGSGDDHLEKKSVLLVDLSKFIPEKTGNITENQYSLAATDNLGLSTIKKIISKAADDPMIEGILINSYSVQGGQATIYDLRNSFQQFRDSTDKFLYAYADLYSQSAYWLSSVSDSIWLNPNGYIDLKGYGVAVPFYKEMLEKVGIEMNIFYAGSFKSATEPYRRTDISEESRYQTEEFLKDMQDIMMSDIIQSRNIDSETLKDIISSYSAGRSTSCEKSGLVDGLMYWNEMNDFLKEKLGIKSNKKINYIKLEKYASFLKSSYNAKIKDKIAVIYAEGEIHYGTKSKGIINDEKYASIIDQLRRDENVKAVVLRVNSPGGNSLSSDNIAYDLRSLKNNNIPLIASFGDYAASGGYYISAFADTIIAQPNTLTGSIGVYVMFPNAQKLMNQHLGVFLDTIKTDPFAVSFTPYLDLDQREAEHLQGFTDELYEKFVGIVAEGRNKSIAEIEEVAQGRVWTGLKAKEIGLVDEIGNLDDAITIAAAKAGIEKYNIVEYPKIKKNPYKELIESIFPADEQASASPQIEIQIIKGYNHLRSYLKDSTPQAKLPYLFFWD